MGAPGIPSIASGRRAVAWVGLVLAVAASGGASACRGAAASGRGTREVPVERRTVEDVFLLTGELRAVESTSIVTPRSEGEMQIRWMAEEGAEVTEGERVVELDSSRVLQTIEERRLKLRRAEIEEESKERTVAADRERKHVAVEKAEVEAAKARVDAAVPRELRPSVEWRR